MLEWGKLGSFPPPQQETGAVRRGPAHGEGDRGVGRVLRTHRTENGDRKGSGGHYWRCGPAQ